MKYTNNRLRFINLSFVAVAAALSPLLLSGSAAAASATLYTSPSTGSYTNGNTITVSVRENSYSDTVNGVQANFTYPTSMLQFEGISSSSAFPVDAPSSGQRWFSPDRPWRVYCS